MFKELYAGKMEELFSMPSPKKFKPGDKVKFIKKYNDFSIGTIVTIERLTPDGYYIKENDAGYFFEKDFELVEEKQEESVKVFKSVAEEWGF